MNFGIRFDAALNSWVELGVELSYAKTELVATDVTSNPYNYNFGYNPYANNFYVPKTRISYKRLAIEVSPKIALYRSDYFKPYISLGLGLSNNSLSYGKNDFNL